MNRGRLIANGLSMLLGAGLTVGTLALLQRGNENKTLPLPLYAQIVGGAILGYITKRQIEYELENYRQE